MNGYVRLILLAVGLSALTIAATLLSPRAASLPVLAVLLGFIAGIYLGFALLDGRRRYVAIESGFIAVIVSLASLGLLASPLFLGAGYILHGVWDAMHHEARGVATRIVRFWPPFVPCTIYSLAYLFAFGFDPEADVLRF